MSPYLLHQNHVLVSGKNKHEYNQQDKWNIGLAPLSNGKDTGGLRQPPTALQLREHGYTVARAQGKAARVVWGIAETVADGDWLKQSGLVQCEAKELLFIRVEQDLRVIKEIVVISHYLEKTQMWMAMNVLKKWPRKRLSALIWDLSVHVGSVTISITCNSKPDFPIMK